MGQLGFPQVLADPGARPKAVARVNWQFQEHGNMLCPEYSRSRSMADRVTAQVDDPPKNVKRTEKNVPQKFGSHLLR